MSESNLELHRQARAGGRGQPEEARDALAPLIRPLPELLVAN
jgi:hypothetical protein